MTKNEFDGWSDAKLSHNLQKATSLEYENKLLTEIEKRNQIKDEQNKKNDEQNKIFAAKTLDTNKKLLYLTWFIAIVTAVLFFINFFEFPKIPILGSQHPNQQTKQPSQNNLTNQPKPTVPIIKK